MTRLAAWITWHFYEYFFSVFKVNQSVHPLLLRQLKRQPRTSSSAVSKLLMRTLTSRRKCWQQLTRFARLDSLWAPPLVSSAKIHAAHWSAVTWSVQLGISSQPSLACWFSLTWLTCIYCSNLCMSLKTIWISFAMPRAKTSWWLTCASLAAMQTSWSSRQLSVNKSWRIHNCVTIWQLLALFSRSIQQCCSQHPKFTFVIPNSIWQRLIVTTSWSKSAKLSIRLVMLHKGKLQFRMITSPAPVNWQLLSTTLMKASSWIQLLTMRCVRASCWRSVWRASSVLLLWWPMPTALETNVVRESSLNVTPFVKHSKTCCLNTCQTWVIT